MKTKKSVSIFCLIFLSILLLLPCISLFVMSFMKYSSNKGLFGSPFVGLASITKFLKQTELIRAIQNTFTISILALILGVIYLIVAIPTIHSFQNRVVKAVVAWIFILPAILPANTYILLLRSYFSTETLVTGSIWLQLIAAAQNSLRFASVFVITALFTKGDIKLQIRKCVLLYIGMKLIRILSTDTGFMSEFSNPLTYEYLDTYDSLLYRIGIYPMQFSQYAAGYVVKIVLQLLPALIGVFLLISLYKSESKNAAAVCSKRKYYPGMALALVPIALLLLIGMASFRGQSKLSLPIVQAVYIYGFLFAVAIAAITISFGLLLASASAQLNKWSLTLITVLYFLSDSLLGPKILCHHLEALDTFWILPIQNMHYILPTAIIGTMLIKDKHSQKLLPALPISAFGLAFAWFWGDHMAFQFIQGRDHIFPISLAMKWQLSTTKYVAVASSSSDEPLSWLPYVLIPIIIAGACFIIGSVLYNKEQKNN